MRIMFVDFLKKFFLLYLELSGVNAFFRWKNAGKVKVLMFHSISPPGVYFDNAISVEDFSASLNYLSKNYSILKLTQRGDFVGYCPDKINVLLTFDDGFVDNFNVAAPIMKRLGISGVFFLIADCLKDGHVPRHINIKSDRKHVFDTSAYQTMTISQVRALLDSGMTIGSHGCAHPDYTAIDYHEGINDALVAKAQIQAVCDVSISAYAFPWGRFQDNQQNELGVHYQRIFTTNHGFNKLDDIVFCRNEVANFQHLRCAVSGSLDFLKSHVAYS